MEKVNWIICRTWIFVAMFMLKVTCLSAQGAIWITTNQSAEGMPLFRKVFEVEKKPETAKLYATALGVYDVSVNGKRVGNHGPLC